MREIRIRNVPDKVFRVAKKMAFDADLSLPAFTLVALGEEMKRILEGQDAAQRRKEPRCPKR